MNSEAIKIQQPLIDIIKDKGNIHTYSVQSDLFYEGQTPIVAYLILEGKINLVKGKKVKLILEKHHLIGVKELMEHLPSRYGAKIMPNTKVSFLDRSTILEILEHKDCDLETFLNELELEKTS